MSTQIRDLYKGVTAATVAAANALIAGERQKMIITVTADENYGGATTRYTYEGSGGLVADFTLSSSAQFQIVNGQQEINTTWLNSFIATYLSSNGFTAGGGGTNAAPVASSVAFTGTATQGQTLTGTYTYSDAESNAEGTSLKKWYRSDNTSALNRAAISGATASTYVLQAGDVGKYIQYAVTPVASTGTTTGTEVFSSYSAVIAALSVGDGFTALPMTFTNGAGSQLSDGTLTFTDVDTATTTQKSTLGTKLRWEIPSSASLSVEVRVKIAQDASAVFSATNGNYAYGGTDLGVAVSAADWVEVEVASCTGAGASSYYSVIIRKSSNAGSTWTVLKDASAVDLGPGQYNISATHGYTATHTLNKFRSTGTV